jgi:hypothetical protein
MNQAACKWLRVVHSAAMSNDGKLIHNQIRYCTNPGEQRRYIPILEELAVTVQEVNGGCEVCQYRKESCQMTRKVQVNGAVLYKAMLVLQEHCRYEIDSTQKYHSMLRPEAYDSLINYWRGMEMKAGEIEQLLSENVLKWHTMKITIEEL